MGQTAVPTEIADVAIEWFVRLRASDVEEVERGNFFLWLRESHVHQQAFVEILRLWEGLAVVKQMDFDELSAFPQIWEFKREAQAKVAG
jgi:ferric-dicitrate binding protein FerR (iron transport regulator)